MSIIQFSSWLDKYRAVNKDTICTVYDKEATAFDEAIGTLSSEAHTMTVTTLNELVLDKNSKILDFAACTGLLGTKIHGIGYTNIDAFDGSHACIEECKKRDGTYTQFISEFVTDAAPLSVATDTYDVVVCSGGFTINHLPISVLSKWIRIVKPGGYVINTFRNRWKDLEPMYNEGKFDNEVQRLEKEQKWTFVRKQYSDPENYHTCYVMHVHKVL
ncbi:methyltransferase-like protein 27 [Antedon mediterranea]|uniref:methyltransferase-like protein 27 n=1 Tax=Antedon mediterranea TaxID=105859 RepID=UPI003AF52C6E